MTRRAAYKVKMAVPSKGKAWAKTVRGQNRHKPLGEETVSHLIATRITQRMD